eukprot:m.50323 g.50323  ORF g.50323 m.50323 type:complete len:949 (+) comp34064_c0_seq16:20-2866(+)
MSRIIVKNLPKSVSRERITDTFSSLGEVTDVKLAKTAKGVFRRFAFVGFKTEKQAEEAVKHFNKAFMDTCKMEVAIAKGIGDESISRPWSKYSKGSSQYDKRQKIAEARKAGLTLEEYEERLKAELLAEEKAEKESALKLKSKSYGMLSKLHEIQKDPQFQEFLDVHQPKSKKAKWANDVEKSELQTSKRSAKKTEHSAELAVSKGNQRESGEGFRNNQEQDDSNHQGKREEKASVLSDMDYLKSKVSTILADKHAGESSSSEKDEKSDKEEEGHSEMNEEPVYTVKMRGIPFRATENDVHTFFKPLNIKEVRIVQTSKGRPSGRAFVDFFSPKDQSKALKRHKDYLGSRYVEVTLDEGVEKWKELDEERKAADQALKRPWEAKASNLPGEEEPIADSGRLFVRNLSYSCMEEELGELFSQFGPLTETFMPLDRTTKKPVGFAFITYLMPEHAVKAFNELDGNIFQGRLLHIMPSRTPPVKAETIDETEAGSYKGKQNRKAKAASQSSHNWNTLFLNPNAIAEVIAAKYATPKGKVLDPETSQSLAVRMALGETEVIQETKDFLQSHGIELNAFEGTVKERSKTVILVKNLPFETMESDLRSMFSPFGDLGRVVCPPAGVTGIVEFTEAKMAKRAFTKLAYAKIKDVPIYLEKAPLQSFTVPFKASSRQETVIVTETEVAASASANQAQTNTVSVSKSQDYSGQQCSLFIKNLDFSTSEESLRKVFEKIGQVDSIVIAKKKDVKTPGNLLSMGYGFIEFQQAGDAKEALKRLQGYQLDGHALELKFSDRAKRVKGGMPSKKATKKDQKSAKILVRNVPFEATPKEIREIFNTFGEIKTLRLPRKAGGKQAGHRGFAFVEYLTKEDAKRAFQSLVHSTHLYGRRLVLEWADEADSLDVLRQKTAEHFYCKCLPSSLFSVHGVLAAGSTPKKRKMIVDTATGSDSEEDLV